MPSLPSRLPSEITADLPAPEAGSQASTITPPGPSPMLNSLALASSSRSQVQARTASAAACLAWDRPSVGVRQRPPLPVAIVTLSLSCQRVGRERLLSSRTLSKPARGSLLADVCEGRLAWASSIG